ncbi:MAG TPA: serine/threonine-protein kinase, partial [Gemmataceae bacterium]|nr:serine/threonine-protein kinase [Gemmataceae bacterium]
MPAPTTIGEFLDLVRKSGVLEDKRLDVYVDKATAANVLPQEPSKLAGLLVRDGILTHFQAEQFLQGKWRRFTIGKYKVLERIGSGGMGSVYLCEHKLMRRRVAVKVLPTAKADDTSSLERFHREARVVAALDHINIVRAYDVDQDVNLHFLVMEYVDGASLQEMVKRGGIMDVTRAAHYMRQAANGLQHGHETAGIVHRDIKPGNILVDRNGIVKILDMGLARFFHDEEDILTKKYDENVLGTADYLAPEQALDSHSVDVRADIYSLGATFYYCLTGKSPFNEGTIAQKLIWHQTRQPKPVRSIRPEVPQAIEALIEKMMAKDPNQRFQTPLEVAEALAPHTTQPIGPPPEIEMPQLCLAAKGGPMAEAGPTTPAPLTPTQQSSAVRKNWQISGAPDSKPNVNSTPAGGNGNNQIKNGVSPEVKAEARNLVADPQPVPQRAVAAAVKLQPAKTSQEASPCRLPTRPAVAKAAAIGLLVENSPPQATTSISEPATDEDSIPWEQIAAQTEIATPHTTPRTNKTGSTRRTVKTEESKPDSRRKQMIRLAALIAIAVFSGIVIAIIVASFLKPSGPAKTTTSRTEKTLTVGKDGSFRTLREALGKAGPGDRIIVKDRVIEDSFKIDGTKNDRLRNVSIEAAAELNGPVIWRLPPSVKGGGSAHLLYVENVPGLTLKGFTLDGGNRINDLIVISGDCPGLTLQELTLQGFKQFAIQVMNCAGEAEKPVSLVDLTMIAAAPEKPKAPIHFAVAPENAGPKKNEFIKIRNCHIRGTFEDSTTPKIEGVDIIN